MKLIVCALQVCRRRASGRPNAGLTETVLTFCPGPAELLESLPIPYLRKILLQEVSHQGGLVRPNDGARRHDIAFCGDHHVFPGLEAAQSYVRGCNLRRKLKLTSTPNLSPSRTKRVPSRPASKAAYLSLSPHFAHTARSDKPTPSFRIIAWP